MIFLAVLRRNVSKNMKRFFKSKFFYVITALTLAAVIIPTVLCRMGLSSYLRSTVNNVLTPVRRLADRAAASLEGYAEYFYRFDSLVSENQRLKEENTALKEEVYNSRELKEQYDWLSEYLDIKMRSPDIKWVNASVFGDGGVSGSDVFMLDRGKNAGIEKFMPVITGDGLLGYISDAGHNWSRVTSVLESSSAVGAYVERSGASGVLEGDYFLASDELCRLSYLDGDADIEVGDRILTEGYGSVYPRDLTVGYVEKTEKDELSRTVTAYVRPSAFSASDSKITEVMVITSYETDTEE